MAKNQGIVRLRGSIDGVTYTEGVNGKLSRSRSSLDKSKMDNNPKFHNLRLAQEELGSFSKYGALLRRGVQRELAYIKGYKGVPRLNKILNAVKNEDRVNRLGKRTVAEGLVSEKGQQLLKEFDFYGKTKVNALIAKRLVIDLASGEAIIAKFNPMEDLIYPEHATHVEFRAIYIGIDFENYIVSSEKSEITYLVIEDRIEDLTLKIDALPEVSNNVFYVVQVVFYKEVNGFKEIEAMDRAALTIMEIKV